MNNYVRLNVRNEPDDGGPIADIYVEVAIIRDGTLEPPECPAGIALGPEEDCALIVIDAEDLEILAGQIYADFRANKTARTCNKGSFLHPGHIVGLVKSTG